eukprot:403371364
MQESQRTQKKLTVQTCSDAMRSILAFMGTTNLLRLQRLNKFMMHVIRQTFFKIKKNSSFVWRLNLDVDQPILEQFKKSKMISLVTKFKINVPDLAGLMILPDILTVIQEKLLDDHRQLTDLNLRPKVELNNASSEIFLEDNFDQFELAKKFNQFSRYSQDFKLFTIKNSMNFLSEEGRIIQYNFLAALENLILDRSIIPNYFGEAIDRSNMTLDIIDLMLKRSKSIYIGSDTYSVVPLSRRSVYNNVKILQIDDDVSYKGGVQKFLMQFPKVQILEVCSLMIEVENNFFAKFENVLKSNMLRHLKHFKIYIRDYFNDCDLKSRQNLDYLFQIIVDIEGPTLELEIKLDCKHL